MSIKAMMTLAKLKDAGDKLQAMAITGPDLVSLAKDFGVDIEPETAGFIAAQIPMFANDNGDTMSDFVTNGGLLRLVGSKIAPKQVATLQLATARCPHCNNLVFH